MVLISSNLIRRTPVRLGFVLAICFTAQVVRSQDASVKPGINSPFESPDPAQWEERFEREGREIYEKRAELVAACRIKQGMAVADVGAGTGLFTRLFAEKVGDGGRVYAIDIAKQFVDHIEETSKEKGLNNVTGVVCATDDCGLEANSVDVVFICDTYHHFEFPFKTLRSIHRSLRPGGALIVIDFRRIEGVSRDWILNHVRAGQETVRKEIEDAGFEFVEEKGLLKDNYFMRFQKATARDLKKK